VAAASGGWRFSDTHLSQAIEEWKQRESPTPEAIDALYEWCISTVDVGPSDSNTLPISEADDLYLAFVPAANVFVVFLAVLQDQSIFVRNIEGRTQ
jgi:hypothetical protein